MALQPRRWAFLGALEAGGIKGEIMPGSKSDYLENKLLDHVLGGGDFVRPATVYVALYTVAPSDTGGGTEVTGGAYARVTYTNNATTWPAAAAGAKSNGAAITFAQATANWGTVVAVGVFDALTLGNLLYWATLTTNKAIDNGDTASFAIGDIDLTED